MRINVKTSTVERNNVGQSSKFTMANTAHMASMLSDMLYSDKIKAVIREISCNGVDSHIEAGTPDLPIDVHLPDAFDKSFWVRDYGVSMTEDTIRNLYSTMGESSKNQSSKFTGGFGIGSKAPFAFTDSFTIETFLDGEHKVYTAFKNETNEREIVLLSSNKTSEKNGIKVSVPVPENNISDFIEKAQDVFKVFSVHPNMFGNSRYSKIEEAKVLAAGSNWKLNFIARHSPYFDNFSEDSILIMGNVAYPIDFSFFDEQTKLQKNQQAALPAWSAGLVSGSRVKMFQSMFQYKEQIPGIPGLVIYADIDSVQPVPSREALNYDEKTIAFLKNAVKNMKKELFNCVNDKINSFDTLWEAGCYFTENYHQSIISEIINIDKIKYKETGKLNYFSVNENLLKNIKIFYACGFEKEDKNIAYNQSGTGYIREQKSLFFVNTENKIGRKKIHKYIINKYNDDKVYEKIVYVIEPKDKNTISDKFNNDVKEFLELAGNPPIIDSKDLIITKKQISELEKLDNCIKVREFGPRVPNKFNDASISKNEENIYYLIEPLNCGNTLIYNSKVYNKEIRCLIYPFVLHFNNFSEQYRYALVPYESRDSVKESKWIEFSSILDNILEKELIKFNKTYNCDPFQLFTYYQSNSKKIFCKNAKCLEWVVKETKNKEFIKEYSEIATANNHYKKFVNEYHNLEFPLIEQIRQNIQNLTDDIIVKKVNALLDKYPIFKLINSVSTKELNDNRNIIINYLDNHKKS